MSRGLLFYRTQCINLDNAAVSSGSENSAHGHPFWPEIAFGRRAP